MIFICSTNTDDSTSNVIDWLLYYKKKFIRLNDGKRIQKLSIYLSNSLTKISMDSFNSNSINSYWYRRGSFEIATNFFTNLKNPVKKKLNWFYYRESQGIQELVNYYLKTEVPSINSFEDNKLNKLIALFEAKQFGLKIPPTLITNNKTELTNFIGKHKQIVVKAISQGFSYQFNKKDYFFHTTLISKNDLKEFPDTFNPILVQEALEKKYELRIFFLNDKFYASAIFSQNDEKTRIDFRNYNTTRPNRVVPYKLPESLKTQLKGLMRKLNLNSGSFDIVVNKKGYFFLEVNPIGQYNQVSDPCNYNLDQIIALNLIKNGAKIS